MERVLKRDFAFEVNGETSMEGREGEGKGSKYLKKFLEVALIECKQFSKNSKVCKCGKKKRKGQLMKKINKMGQREGKIYYGSRASLS